MQRPNAAASASEATPTEQRIQTIEADIARFTLEKEKAVRQIREYMAQENPRAGVSFAGEIFAAQQDKLRLEVEIELCRKKINRLRLGYAEDAPAQPPADKPGGFLF